MGNCSCVIKDNQNFELKTEKTKSSSNKLVENINSDEKLMTSIQKIQSHFRGKQARSKLKSLTNSEQKHIPHNEENMLATSTPLKASEFQSLIVTKT